MKPQETNSTVILRLYVLTNLQDKKQQQNLSPKKGQFTLYDTQLILDPYR